MYERILKKIVAFTRAMAGHCGGGGGGGGHCS
jgi:hypothetical protein